MGAPVEMNYGAEDSVSRPRSRWAAILIDVHFWVPAVVLLIGLILLRLVQ
jgi:hypothetical protein